MSTAVVERPATTSKPARRYKLNQGLHIGPDPVNPALDKVYDAQDPANNIIESPTDLTFMNVPGFKPKFEIVPEHGVVVPNGAFVFDPSKETVEQFAERMKAAMTVNPGAPAAPSVPPAPINLDAMNAEQLKRYAEEEEINVGKATTKEQLLAAIKGRK